MANVVAKLLLRMGVVRSESVVFVNNSLELLGSYVGQTPQKVDAKVAEAAGGVLFIDEAYSIVKEGGGRDGASGSSFGKEAIDTLMKHLDPPACVMIFAGYSKEMEDFLSVNPGLARRIPYRYTFHAYSTDQLMQVERRHTDTHQPSQPNTIVHVRVVQQTTQQSTWQGGLDAGTILDELLSPAFSPLCVVAAVRYCV